MWGWVLNFPVFKYKYGIEYEPGSSEISGINKRNGSLDEISQNGTAYGNRDDLLDGISLRTEDGTKMLMVK